MVDQMLLLPWPISQNKNLAWNLKSQGGERRGALLSPVVILPGAQWMI